MNDQKVALRSGCPLCLSKGWWPEECSFVAEYLPSLCEEGRKEKRREGGRERKRERKVSAWARAVKKITVNSSFSVFKMVKDYYNSKHISLTDKIIIFT